MNWTVSQQNCCRFHYQHNLGFPWQLFVALAGSVALETIGCIADNVHRLWMGIRLFVDSHIIKRYIEGKTVFNRLSREELISFFPNQLDMNGCCCWYQCRIYSAPVYLEKRKWTGKACGNPFNRRGKWADEIPVNCLWWNLSLTTICHLRPEFVIPIQ